MSLLEIEGLRTEIATREGRVHAVDGVSLTVDAGKAVGLVGESGSGKTMTGMSVMRLLPKGGSTPPDTWPGRPTPAKSGRSCSPPPADTA